MAEPTSHVDTFVRDNLPRGEGAPDADFTRVPELAYPPRLNCASVLLDGRVAAGDGDRVAIYFEDERVTYADLLARANRYARVLVEDLGVVPGGRVLLRGANTPSMVALWFAVIKAGAVAVTTMPMLRARELGHLFAKAKVGLAVCDARLSEELESAKERAGAEAPECVYFATDDPSGLDALAATKPATFSDVDTAADDPVLVAFTSGTTGQPKGAVHFHRDVLAVTDTFPRYVLRATRDDVFCGTPPLAFTFGLGVLVLFPFRVGAATILLEKPSPDALLSAIAKRRATIVATAPTMYRALLGALSDGADKAAKYDLSSLTKGISAGETLPLATYEAWRAATGIKLIDGLGSTELLHIVIASSGDDIRPGATGKVIPGYEARVVDDEGKPVPPGTIGKLAVRGPTGCRYLADPERQKAYVKGGWNLTGDAYEVDEDGYFWFRARADDMIISAGYNIAGPEVENVLLEHPRVKECAVVGAPDEDRGFVVKAFVVLREEAFATAATVTALQEHVKATIAPYKYPRVVEFVRELPRTETGKIQRYKLRAT